MANFTDIAARYKLLIGQLSY